MNLEEKYNLKTDSGLIEKKVKSLESRAEELKDKELFRKIFGLIDLTTLDVADNDQKILQLISKVNEFDKRFNGIPNVAAMCVYPNFIPLLNSHLKDPLVKKAAVGGSFPSSQTFREVKLQEILMTVEAGADEIDIVLPLGKYLEGEFDEIFEEISMIKKQIGEKHLKVILETGLLKDLDKIKHASFLSLEAGADFIKTSTGKNGDGASPEAVFVMCEAIREYHDKSGRKAGIKPAGGISNASSAVQYYLIVYEILGKDWLNPSLFRIGASRLANNLLGQTYF